MYLATLRVYRPLHAVSVAGVAAVIIGTHASVGSVGVSEAPGACNAVPLANIVFGGLDHGPPVAAEGPDHLQPPAGRTRPEVAPGPVVAPTSWRPRAAHPLRCRYWSAFLCTYSSYSSIKNERLKTSRQ